MKCGVAVREGVLRLPGELWPSCSSSLKFKKEAVSAERDCAFEIKSE